MNTRSLLGKIARLPHHIRQQINRRLLNGDHSPAILPWLNSLPAVKKIIADQFAGKPINHRNLSNWRAIGYQRWLEEERPLLEIQEQAGHARRYARLARGLADGAAAIAANRLFQLLRSNPNFSHEDLLKILPAINALVRAGQNDVRLKHSKCKLRQRDAQLLLMRDKHQRDVISIGRRMLDDERSKLIQFGPFSNAEKIELLGRHIFGDLWIPRILPVPGDSSSSSSKNENGLSSEKGIASASPKEMGSAGVPPAASRVSREASPAFNESNPRPPNSLSQRERAGVREKSHEKGESNESDIRPPESLDPVGPGGTGNLPAAPLAPCAAAEIPSPNENDARSTAVPSLGGEGQGEGELKTQNSKFPTPPEITPDKTTAQIIAEIEEYAIQDAAARRAAASNESCTRPLNSLSQRERVGVRESASNSVPVQCKHESSPEAIQDIHPSPSSHPFHSQSPLVTHRPGFYGPCPAPHSWHGLNPSKVHTS